MRRWTGLGAALLAGCSSAETGLFHMSFAPVETAHVPYDADAIDFFPDGALLVRDGEGLHLLDAGWALVRTLDAASLQGFAISGEALFVLREGALQRSDDRGQSFTPVALPVEDAAPTDLASDADGVLYVTALAAFGGGSTTASIYRAAAGGDTLGVVAQTLTGTDGSAAQSADLLTVDGALAVSVCGTLGCEVWRGEPDGALVTGWDTFNILSPVDRTADGYYVAFNNFSSSDGRPWPDVPEIALTQDSPAFLSDIDWDHFHTRPDLLPGAPLAVGPDGTLYAASNEGVLASVRPFTRSEDMRAELLQGPGCASQYKVDHTDEVFGGDLDIEIANETGVAVRLWEWDGGLNQFFGWPLEMAAGETATQTLDDRVWAMALDADGNCRGFFRPVDERGSFTLR